VEELKGNFQLLGQVPPKVHKIYVQNDEEFKEIDKKLESPRETEVEKVKNWKQREKREKLDIEEVNPKKIGEKIKEGYKNLSDRMESLKKMRNLFEKLNKEKNMQVWPV